MTWALLALSVEAGVCAVALWWLWRLLNRRLPADHGHAH